MIWVVGDIHGMFDPLKTLLNRIKMDIYSSENIKNAKIIFLGDYIDHGESSKEVIDLLLELKEEFDVVFLAGNHEDLLLQYVNESDLFKTYGNVWFKDNGAKETIVSLSPIKNLCMKNFSGRDGQNIKWNNLKIENKYLEFFNKLKYSHIEQIGTGEEVFKFVFTHAGINPEKDIDKQLDVKNYDDFHSYLKNNKEWIENSIIWMRNMPEKPIENYIFINGHTPTIGIDKYCSCIGNYDVQSGKPFFNFGSKEAFCNRNGSYYYFSNVNKEDLISINIDTGAILGKYLTAIKIPDNLIEERKIQVIQVPTSGIRRSGYCKIENYYIKVPYCSTS